MERYDPQRIEAKWQEVWARERTWEAADPDGGDATAPKFYMLEMLPYPSGHLHMGHVLNYTLGDVVTHFHRRNGRTVLRPMGFATIGRQMRRLGWAIDWTREVSAHEPEYYRWTQWLFLKFLEAGLAYRKEAPVNWCPNDQTVLANEQVIDGRCERCGAEVESKRLEQWFFRITDYADALIEDHRLIDWPERTKAIQRNWIGRSEGAEILFRIEELGEDVPVFTTRPDTLFGATFFVLAPEHPLVERMAEASPNADEL